MYYGGDLNLSVIFYPHISKKRKDGYRDEGQENMADYIFNGYQRSLDMLPGKIT